MLTLPMVAEKYLAERHRSVGIFEQAYADWGQIRANAPVTPRIA